MLYDSHEIFCEVPELQKTPIKKRIWEKLERSLVPKLKHCITVNQSIADYFKEKYNTSFTIVRNIPLASPDFKLKSKSQLNLPANKKIIIFQGAGINIERGAEELVEAMKFTEGVQLLVIGSGDVFPKLKKLITELNLTHKITIIDKLPKTELLHYTYNSDLGISIDKDSNLNYHFSLPNKIFDYLQAQLPILASRLPEIENLMNTYSVGDFIESHDPEHIAKKINETLNSASYSQWKENTRKAIAENNWENEKLKLIDLINTIK